MNMQKVALEERGLELSTLQVQVAEGDSVSTRSVGWDIGKSVINENSDDDNKAGDRKFGHALAVPLGTGRRSRPATEMSSLPRATASVNCRIKSGAAVRGASWKCPTTYPA